MEFRDLKRQYARYKQQIDEAVIEVMLNTNFISGRQVSELEERLAAFAGRKYCIACANGTDALQLALMAMGVGEGDAVFVPDFTFFSTAEVVSLCSATPVFIDILEDTFNMDPVSLETAVQNVLKEGKLIPRVVIPVDLFGLPADYPQIETIAEKYGLEILEDGAQGFGGNINGKRVCSFGKMSTTSFFPAKPLGCYGDGGAVFTDDDEMAELLRSLRVHGKGSDKYDNVRIGLNSRLDTMQAAILKIKLEAFEKEELDGVNQAADQYSRLLSGIVKIPNVPEGYYSSWAQYSILLENKEQRDGLMAYLKENDIPSMIYYRKPMHEQGAFTEINSIQMECPVTVNVCDRVLALPMHPYLTEEEIDMVAEKIKEYLENK